MAILTDVLNEMQLTLRKDPALRVRLRTLLADLYSLNEYADWEKEGQYSGHRFRLPRRFISHSVSDRRLLESLRLVVDDMLEVKINLIKNGPIFITDGLFVPPDYRAFPFLDESYHLLR